MTVAGASAAIVELTVSDPQSQEAAKRTALDTYDSDGMSTKIAWTRK